MTDIPILTVELLARGLQWHDGTPARITQELARLDAIPYFLCERHFLGEGRRLVVVGILRHKSAHGRIESFRVRLEYPDRFPGGVPAIFDHDHLFEPSAEGHLYPDWQLCLTFPERKEFDIGAHDLSAQVLDAALIWFHKRGIFERNGQKSWPGDAEPHGYAPALALLLLERSGLISNHFFVGWIVWMLHTRQPPRFDAPCPCNSGRNLRECHSMVAQQIHRAMIARS